MARTTVDLAARSMGSRPSASGFCSGTRGAKPRPMSTRKKIALIGAGNIGGELAALVAKKELGDVVLFDIPQKADFAKGKALDLEQNSAVLGYDARITGTSSWADCAGS